MRTPLTSRISLTVLVGALGASTAVTPAAAQELPLSMNISGRVLVDAGAYDGDLGGLSNGSELRQARVGVEGGYGDLWDFKFEIDFGDSRVTVKDAYIGYGGFSRGSIRVGAFKEPVSLENLTSTRHITFMERGVVNALVPDRHMGVGGSFAEGSFLIQGGLFGQAIPDVGAPALESSEGWAATGRVSIAPVLEPERLVHVGLSASHRTPDASAGGAEEVSFSSGLESHIDRTKFLDTGDIGDVDHHALIGLEAAVIHGPYSLQAEYIRTSISGIDSSDDAVIDGAYVYASWFPFGGSRGYRGSEHRFDAVVMPRSGGALELAVRASTLDLNGEDGEIGGGSADQLSFGANWYFTRDVRMMANVVVVDNDEFADADGDFAGNDDFTAFQMRFQISF